MERQNSMSLMLSCFMSALKSFCASNNHIAVKKLHCLILKNFTGRDVYFSNNLIVSYAKLDALTYARRVFDQIPEPNIFSWNSILSAYALSGRLSDMQLIFGRMQYHDDVSWNSVISGFAHYGSPIQCVEMYMHMLQQPTTVPNRITLSTLLILSSNCGMVDMGQQIHGHTIKFGFNSSSFIGSALVDMYTKMNLIKDAKEILWETSESNLIMHNSMITGLFRCGMIQDSMRLFNEMRERDSVSWTIMITGFAQNCLYQEALNMMRGMRVECLPLDQFTFGSALTACGSLSALIHGKQIHAYILRTNYSGNLFVGSALVDMYSKCKCIRYAEVVFKGMTKKNIVSWTAMLVGYSQNGSSEEAVKIFLEMQDNGVSPDHYTLGSVISSCANRVSIEEGAQFHCCAILMGLVSYLTVSNAIITLYGKCGDIRDAHRLFDEIDIKDQVSWTAMVSAYAQFGKAKETIELFEYMLVDGLKPDGVTFIGVISACSRAGLVEKGCHYFKSMVECYHLTPVADHYTCMIDLFSRSGRLKEAENFIKQMPYNPDAIGWATLLSSCRLHSCMELGKWAAESLLELEPQNPAGYLLLADIYSSKGKWDEVSKLRRRMRDNKVRKEPGCSWIKYKKKIYIFSADDKSNPYTNHIYTELEKINRRMIEDGFVPDLSLVLHDVKEEEKMQMLSHHSEKLAIAFGLIFIPHGLPIKVIKNLRVCGDCHTATKYISKITGREILVRDAVRFHEFKDGICSCGDFW